MPGRRERQAILKVEAARILKGARAGAWKGVKVLHCCGTARALEVTFARDSERFYAKVLDGEIVELECFKRGKAAK